MKRKGKIFIALLAVALLLCVATVTLAACGDKNDDAPQISGGSGTTPSEHEHTFEEKWSYNDEYHWHAANCGHDDQIKDRAEHELVWTTTTPPSCEDDGVQTGTCVCGYSETKSIDALEHDFNTAWIYDDYEHWHKCSRCDETDAHIAHELVDHNCDCGYSEFTPESEFTFSEIDGEWAITGYSGNRSVVVIPSTYRGRDVVELGMGAFYGNTSIKKVYIPDTVTSMRDGVFDGCVNIEEVTSPAVDLSSVPKDNLKKLTLTNATRIEAEAFKDYTKLAEIEFCDTLTFVGKDAFANTAWLNAKKGVVYIGKVLYTYVGTTPNSFELSVEDDTIAISPSAFEGKNIYQVTIPNSVSIGANAFKDTNIQRAIISTSAIAAIPKSNLRYLEFTSGTSIIKGALQDCIYLQELVLQFVGGNANATEASASTLFGYIFASSKPTENTSYYQETKQNYGEGSSKTVTYYIPSNIRNVTINGKILYGAFNNCKSLQTVTIGESVQSIGSTAFAGCINITKLNYLGTLKGWCEIGFGADWNDDDEISSYYSNPLYVANSKKVGTAKLYLNDEEVTGDVNIPSGTTRIASSVFYGLTGITSVTIPDSVTSIGDNAFEDCKGLQTVTIGKGVQRIGKNAFVDCGGLQTVNWNATKCTSVGEYRTYKGRNYDFTIFRFCTKLAIVNIGEDVQTIPKYAFYNCTGLQTVTIPDSVTSIGDSAFYLCTNITTVNYLGTLKSWCEIYFGDNPLTSKAKLYLNDELVTEVKDLDGLTKIPANAFHGSGITSVTIPESVTSIDSRAFSGCTGLQTVTIGKGVISIGNSAFLNCTNLQTVNWNATNCTETGSSGSTIFKGCTQLATVNIGEDVQAIPSYAFSGCTGLQTVTIGSGVTSIGSSAFYGCKNIASVTYPASAIGYIPKDSLTTVTITSGKIGARAFEDCTSLRTVTIGENVTSIGSYAFYNCTGLSEITIPDSVTRIGGYAFGGCTGITKVNYLGTLKGWCEIEFDDSYYSSNPLYAPNYNKAGKAKLYLNDELVTEVKDLDGLTAIPSYAFYGLTDIISVTIPASVTSIGDYAFHNCTGITKVNVASLKAWCEIEFGSYNANPLYAANSNTAGRAKIYVNDELLTEVKDLDGVTSIPQYAFYGLTDITSVTIPESVTSIGNKAFLGCTGLKSFAVAEGNAVYQSKDGIVYKKDDKSIWIVPEAIEGAVEILDGCTSIGSEAFRGCTGLSEITIPDSVQSIGNSAYSGCTGLQTVNWNATNCTKVGAYESQFENYTIFKGCTQLATVNIGENVQSIPSYAFYCCTGLKDISIPDSVTSIGGSAFNGCTGLQTVMIGSGVQSIGYSAFSGCTGLSEITIPDSVQSIGDYAFIDCTGLQTVNWNATNCTQVGSYSAQIFEGCTQLATVNIGENVRSIPSYAFKYCTGLSEITISDSVTSIGDSAFNGCTGLQTVTIGEGVTSIGNSAFYGCTGLSEITIPDSVQSIGGTAFSGCTGLQTLTIGEGVQSIGRDAFNGCKGITKVNVASLKAWCKIVYWDDDDNPLHAANSNTAGRAKLYVNDELVTEVKDLDGVTSIPGYAFYGLTDITSATIPASVTRIGDSAFNGCTGLQTVTIPASVTRSIGRYAFYNCIGLQTVTINAKSIGLGAFMNCTGLSEITIPDSVQSIGEYAFRDCTGLQTVTIGEGVTSIGNSAFYGCTGLSEITIPDSVQSIGSSAFCDCTKLNSVTFENPNGWYYTSSNSYTGGFSISSSSLQNVATAANYLKSTYCSYYWYRKDN